MVHIDFRHGFRQSPRRALEVSRSLYVVGVSADSLDIARRIGERDGETFSDRPKTGVSDNHGSVCTCVIPAT